MTKREQDIYNLIEQNPFITQNEIAEKLNITRSAISGYINTMYKKGIIKGRAYVLSEESYPLLIGPSHIDIVSICGELTSENMYKSTETSIVYGGPTKNTSDFLLNLNLAPHAIFSVASDSFGISFLDSCKKLGIKVDSSVIVDNANSPVYVEMISTAKEIIASSFAGDNLTSHITVNHLKAHHENIEKAHSIIIHDSVNPEVAEYLQTFKPNASLLLISSNIEYTRALRNHFHVFDTTIFSYHIALELLGSNETYLFTNDVSEEDVTFVAKKLLSLGFKKFYIQLSSSQLCYCDDNKLTIHYSNTNSPTRQLNYRLYMKFRDLFAAVIPFCYRELISPVETLDYLAAARNNIFSLHRFSDIGFNRSTLNEYLSKLEVTLSSIPLN